MKKIKRERITLDKLQVVEYNIRKKRMTQGIGFLAILVVVAIACCMSSYMLKEKDGAEYIRNVYEKSHVDYLYTDYSVSSNLKNKMVTFIESLPEDMKTRIQEDWVIVVSEKIPSNLTMNSMFALQNYDTSDLLNGGFTYNSKRIVYVCSSFKENIVYGSFVHEIGHLVSFEKGCEHGKEEWINLYYQERNAFPCDGYYASNSAEFFANAFMEYYNDAEKLQKVSPEIYNYVENVMATDVDRNNMDIFEEAVLNFTTGLNSYRTYYYMYAQN